MGKLIAMRRWSRYLTVMAIVGLLAIAVTACGGGGSSSSSSGESTEAPAESTETTASATEAEEGESGGEEAGSSAVASFVAEAEKEPEFAIQKALPSKPEPGKVVFCLKNEVAQSQIICNGARKASEAVDFKYEERSYDSADASALIVLMKEVLQSKPDLVVFGGDPEAIWGQVKPEYEKAGVSLVPIFVGPVKEDKVVLGNVAGTSTQEKAAKISADWFIQESGGKGTALIQTVPGFPVIGQWQGFIEEDVETDCEACSTQTIEASLEELGSGAAVQGLVSALQSEQSIEYAIAYNNNFLVGIAHELENAGLPDVKVGGWSGTAESVTDTLQGHEFGWILFNQEYTGWMAVNIYLDHLAGIELTPEEEVLPMQLITTKNATKEIAESANEFSMPSDFQQQFKKLWGVG